MKHNTADTQTTAGRWAEAFTALLGLALAAGAVMPLAGGLLMHNPAMAWSGALIMAGGLFVALSELVTA